MGHFYPLYNLLTAAKVEYLSSFQPARLCSFFSKNLPIIISNIRSKLRRSQAMTLLFLAKVFTSGFVVVVISSPKINLTPKPKLFNF